MDAIATARMEEFAKGVLKLSPETQTEFFNEMVKSGMMTVDEAEGLKQYVALFHMFTDQRYYNAVKVTVSEMYMNEIN